MTRASGLLALLATAVVLLVGCRDERITSDKTIDVSPPMVTATASRESAGSPAVERDLAALRSVTAKFHTFEDAKAAGWGTEITGCMTDPVLGGMGFHYGNPRLINGTVSVESPELLLYEPEKNGRLRLVAVEYIIPFSEVPRTAKAPRLFDRDFKPNDVFQLWGLHAWVWEDNPSGMFADWNPRVNCDNTTDVSAMVHN